MYAPNIVMVTHYFEKRRNIALGIATCGSGLGLFVFPPLIELLFRHYSYFGTMLIMGAVLLNCALSAAVCRPLILMQPTSVRVAYKKAKQLALKEKKSELKNYLDLTLWKDPSFVLFVLSLGLVTSCYVPSHYLLVDMASARDIPQNQASFLLSVVGIMDMLTRIFSGLLLNLPFIRNRKQEFYSLAILLTGATSVLFIVAPSYPWFMLLAILQGMGCGIVTAQRAGMATDLVGVSRMSSSFGLTLFTQGVGLIAGPAIAGETKQLSLPAFSQPLIYCK